MKWYVVYTIPRWEKKVAVKLANLDIEYYAPMNKVRRRWSDRYKTIEEPLFKGYVFIRLQPEKKWEVRTVNGIINFLHFEGKPAIVQDKEIDTIKKFLMEFDDVSVVDKSIEVNNEVLIRQGVLMNYKGIVVEKNGNTAVVQINSLNLQLTATFKTNNLERI